MITDDNIIFNYVLPVNEVEFFLMIFFKALSGMHSVRKVINLQSYKRCTTRLLLVTISDNDKINFSCLNKREQ